MYLTELFGDVPFLNKVIKVPTEGLIPRESKKVIIDQILADLKKAAEVLPYSWKGEPERITKGAALGLHARISLYNGYYAEAAASTKEIMDNEQAFGYSLHANYGELFQLAGQASAEIMFIMPFKYEYYITTGLHKNQEIFDIFTEFCRCILVKNAKSKMRPPMVDAFFAFVHTPLYFRRVAIPPRR